MANVAHQKKKMYIGECGPIIVRAQGQATYGDLIRYIRKRYKIYPDDIAILYGKIVEGSPVTGRHILRMEQTDSFFPKNPNRRWVLATLLRMPPELMAYLSLEAVTPGQEISEKPLFSSSRKAIDTAEYYGTLQTYWIEGYPKGVEYAIKDVKHRIVLLKDKVLFESSLERALMTRLLCGYKILLADIAQEQQCYAAAEQYLTEAFSLAGEKQCYDLQAIALMRREMLFKNTGKFDAALADFNRAQQLEPSIAPQIWGQMLTLASMSEARLAQNEGHRADALKYLDAAEELPRPISPGNFLFFATFDKERYLLDSAEALITSPIKKWRSPEKAEEYLTEATKQSNTKGKSVNAYRQVGNDLIQAQIYCDQEYYPIAAATAENALMTLKGLQSKVYLNKITPLLAEIKEHYPQGIEVASLELELMKVQQPYLFA